MTVLGQRSFIAVSVLLIFGLDTSSGSWIGGLFYSPPTAANCRDMTPFADMEDCTSYYQCFRTGATWTLIHSMCPPQGKWDDEYKACVEGTCGAATTTTKSPKPTTKTTVTTKKPPTPSSPSPKPKTTTKGPTSTTKKTTTGSTRKPVFLCPSSGTFAHPTDRNKYYTCHWIGQHYYYYVYLCPPFSCFQNATKTCTRSFEIC